MVCFRPALALLAALALSAAPALAKDQVKAFDKDTGLQLAEPEAVGLSKPRLQAMADHFAAQAKAHVSPGYVILVARYGKLVFSSTSGFRDLESASPMTADTRFLIASMTKPVTSAAVMMLVESGQIHLLDPVAKFIPEFADMKVAAGFDDKGQVQTEALKRPITVQDLLTHTSGLGYVFDFKSPLGKIWREADLMGTKTLSDFASKIATLPLYFQPGDRFFYSFADDVLGRVVEVASGMPFDKFLSARLFEPLGMKSTGFYIPSADRAKMVTLYRHDAEGNLVPEDYRRNLNPSDPSNPPMGGGALISTAADYMRFAQMLANGGTFAGKRYLSPVTVAQMTRDRMKPNAQEQFWGPNSAGLGYGLGLGVVTDSGRAPYAAMDGDFSWGGLFDTQWFASPKTGIVAVLLTQINPVGEKAPRQTNHELRNLLYAAVEKIDAAPAQ
jgi:CubicO group peptidase (beta-lactamase class C family)